MKGRPLRTRNRPDQANLDAIAYQRRIQNGLRAIDEVLFLEAWGWI